MSLWKCSCWKSGKTYQSLKKKKKKEEESDSKKCLMTGEITEERIFQEYN